MPMVPAGHKTLVHYPDGTSKVITLYVRPVAGQVIWGATHRITRNLLDIVAKELH